MNGDLAGSQTTSIGLIAAGKTKADISDSSHRKFDALFVNQRIDQLTIESRTFEHCVFVGMGFKNGFFQNSKFKHCTFVRCYFRNSSISGCEFTGSRFEECDFKNAIIINSKFEYTIWRSSRISEDQMLANMPEWPNVSHQLLVELRNNAVVSGNNKAAKRFHIEALKQTKLHDYRIMTNANSYYNKYTFWERIKAGVRWIRLTIEKYAWGYGEQPLYLLLSGFGLLLLFATYYFINNPKMFCQGKEEYTLSGMASAFEYSIRAFANSTPPNNLSFDSFPHVTIVQTLFGMVFASLLAAVVYRWISTREF